MRVDRGDELELLSERPQRRRPASRWPLDDFPATGYVLDAPRARPGRRRRRRRATPPSSPSSSRLGYGDGADRARSSAAAASSAVLEVYRAAAAGVHRARDRPRPRPRPAVRRGARPPQPTRWSSRRPSAVACASRDGVGSVARAGSRASSRSPRAAARRSRGSPCTSWARTLGRVDLRASTATPATSPSAAISSRAERRDARADVVDARLAARGEQPVGAHDVAHVGEVAPRVGAAGDDPHRVLAGVQPARDLAREVGDRVDRLLARAGVVERARADRPAARARRRRSPASRSRGRLRDRVRVLRAQRRVLGRRDARPAARTPRPSRPTTTTALRRLARARPRAR